MRAPPVEVKLAFDGKGRDDFHKMLEEALQRKGWEVTRPASAPTAPRAPTLAGASAGFRGGEQGGRDGLGLCGAQDPRGQRGEEGGPHLARSDAPPASRQFSL